MLSTIESVNNVVNNFIWGVPAMICIIGVGLLLSVRTGFIQIRKFPYAMKVTIGRMLRKKDATDGAMTPFQAVCTALAATVGTDVYKRQVWLLFMSQSQTILQAVLSRRFRQIFVHLVRCHGILFLH